MNRNVLMLNHTKRRNKTKYNNGAGVKIQMCNNKYTKLKRSTRSCNRHLLCYNRQDDEVMTHQQ